MLTSIEISGFKSFADATRMEFTDGISALVGPNGSGKSNVVDAIKWVLGEQSMKKLRGNEVTDVIFNGSATRQPLGAAEVTLSFSNAENTFSLDSKEIHITRRVYRSGESEYLLNRQASRLKDIRDIISGTGLGSQAYSIIEQGRVEALLQSTSQQRRVVFEEAAGIARFSAKRQETQRRLERSQVNLLRLSDMVNEVESQLRSTKLQAGKAQQYRDFTDRLRWLRTEVGRVEWYQNSSSVQRLEEETAILSQREKELVVEIRAKETELAEITATYEKNDQETRQTGTELAALCERIDAERKNREYHAAQTATLEQEIIEHGQHLLELNARNGDTEVLMRQTEDDLFQAKRLLKEVAEAYTTDNAELEWLGEECTRLQAEEDRIGRLIQQQKVEESRLAGELSGLESRLQTIEHAKKNKEKRWEELQTDLETIQLKRKELQTLLQEQTTLLEEKKRAIASLGRRKGERAGHLDTIRQYLAPLRLRQSGLVERVSLLEELLRRHEGLSPGVREVLDNMTNPESPFRFSHGLVGDLFRVSREAACLIELALGPKSQYIVVSPIPELFHHIENHCHLFAGQVGFIWLDPQATTGHFQGRNYEDVPGVIGRADQFVEADSSFEHLVERLLAKTWIVETLAHAKGLYRESDGRTSFVTLRGDFLAADGSLVVGPPHTGSGLISRRSELRDLTLQLESLQKDILQKTIDMELAETDLTDSDKRFEVITEELRKVAEQLDDLRLQEHTHENRDRHARESFEQVRMELDDLVQEQAKVIDKLTDKRSRKATLDITMTNFEAELQQCREEHQRTNAYRQEQVKKVTNLKIEKAKCEERLESTTKTRMQYHETRQERIKLLGEHSRRYSDKKNQRDIAEMIVLRLESQIAALFARKEKVQRESLLVVAEHHRLKSDRNKLQVRLKKQQQELAKFRDDIHSKQLERSRLQQELQTVAVRLKEDYGIEFSPNDHCESIEEEVFADKKKHLPAYRKEIEDLRDKLQRIGSVNLEAIEALDSLELRYTTLFNQYNDILKAKQATLKLIDRINVNINKLFEETLDSVRIYFCNIFQQLFGGGHADLIIENPENPLEGGVDIVVRPPGKELKNIMLMSGGEKTLTCVALLLAIFQHRSSPVCILDEVDAALDEGNIGRFVNVLQNLEIDTQFLIITHSRKTMMAAKTIYGVTMQDSGVSKLIAVQFSNVGEHGEILIHGNSTSDQSKQESAA